MSTTNHLCDQFLGKLDQAAKLPECHARCQAVKQVLETAFHDQLPILDEKFLAACSEKYARRLLYRDPEGLYSVVVMVWGPGQGTFLHDHAGEWCVECVYRGRIQVKSFDIVGADDADVVQFLPKTEVMAGIGEAGALIPPFDYHTISNALPDQASTTVHVYGHELSWCHVFVPAENGYRREVRQLGYVE